MVHFTQRAEATKSLPTEDCFATLTPKHSQTPWQCPRLEVSMSPVRVLEAQGIIQLMHSSECSQGEDGSRWDRETVLVF